MHTARAEAALTIGQRIASAFIYLEAIDRRALSRIATPLTTAQYHALSALAAVPEQSLGEMAERLICDKANASNLMDRLTEMGLATRERDPEDGRRVIVALTPQGRMLLEAATTARSEALQGIFSPLDQSELDVLTRQLVQLVALLRGGVAPAAR